jgi:hypothetical protein
LRLPSVTFSLHQSGEKQGFLLDEIAITASVVTIWEQAANRREKAGATTSCHVCTANALKEMTLDVESIMDCCMH